MKNKRRLACIAGIGGGIFYPIWLLLRISLTLPVGYEEWGFLFALVAGVLSLGIGLTAESMLRKMKITALGALIYGLGSILIVVGILYHDPSSYFLIVIGACIIAFNTKHAEEEY